MNTKKNILWISVAYIFYFAMLWIIGVTCNGSGWCDIQEDGFLVQALYFFAPLFPTLLLSLVTYKMRDDVFRAWWRFARWFAPVIIVVTILLENAGGGGGIGISGAVSNAFDIIILGILYAILIIVSIILIVRKYFATRHNTN